MQRRSPRFNLFSPSQYYVTSSDYKINCIPNYPFTVQACFYVDVNKLDLAECLRVLGHFRLVWVLLSSSEDFRFFWMLQNCLNVWDLLECLRLSGRFQSVLQVKDYFWIFQNFLNASVMPERLTIIWKFQSYKVVSESSEVFRIIPPTYY